jgi:hypothetical protein
VASTADIAQAVAEDLNRHAFALPFSAVRAYLPLYDLGEMSDLHVTVVPVARTTSPGTRDLLQVDHRIEIAVQQKVPVEEVEAVDPLLALVRSIANHLVAHPIDAVPGAHWIRTEHSPFIAPEHLHELRQFTSVIAVTYRTWEPPA